MLSVGREAEQADAGTHRISRRWRSIIVILDPADGARRPLKPAEAEKQQPGAPNDGQAQQDLHAHRRRRHHRPCRRIARVQGRSAHGRDRRCRRGEFGDRRRVQRSRSIPRTPASCSAASRTTCSISAPISRHLPRISPSRETTLRITASQVERLGTRDRPCSTRAGAAAQLHPARRPRRCRAAPSCAIDRAPGRTLRRRRRAGGFDLSPQALAYLNRLSDLLFVAAPA